MRGKGKNSREEDKRRLLRKVRLAKEKGIITSAELVVIDPRTPPTQKLFTRFRALKPREFKQHYGEISHLIEVLFQYQWPEGFQCSDCQSQSHSIIRTRCIVECNQCFKRFTLRANTPLQNSKLSIPKWFEGYYYWCHSRGVASRFQGIGNPYGTKITDVERKLSPESLIKKIDVSCVTAKALLRSFANDSFWEGLKARKSHYEQVLAKSCFARGGTIKTWRTRAEV